MFICVMYACRDFRVALPEAFFELSGVRKTYCGQKHFYSKLVNESAHWLYGFYQLLSVNFNTKMGTRKGKTKVGSGSLINPKQIYKLAPSCDQK